MPRKRRLRCRTAVLFIVALVAGSCTGSDEAQEQPTTTSTSVTASADADALTLVFVNWYNAITSGDAPAPTCTNAAPVWVASSSLAPSSSGPLLLCADRTPGDELVIRLVNNASGPLTIGYPDAAAGWVVSGDDADAVTKLPGDTGALVRAGASATLTANVGTWNEQDLSLAFAERWAIIEATSQIMTALDLDDTFAWAADLAEECDVDTVAAADAGAPLEAGLHEYFGCVFDALGDAADDGDRAALNDVVPMVAELVERARNVASQQRAGVVLASLTVVSELPEPAGPSIDATTTTPPTIRPPTTKPPTTAPPTTKPPTTRPPTTPVPSTATPTTAAPTTPAPTTTVPKKVTTTEENPDLTVPLPPAPVLVALETVDAGVETYTSWPAIDPKRGRLPGGQIVVIECKAFTSATTAGGNGWWYRLGSGDAAGGWASATGFKNLVSGVAPGSTSPSNVSETVSPC